MRKLIRTAGVALGTTAVGLLLSAGPVLAQTGSGSETTTTTGAGSGSGPTDTGASTTTTAGNVLPTTDTSDLGGVGGTDILPKTGGPEAALLIGAGGLLGTAVGARFLLRRRQPASR